MRKQTLYLAIIAILMALLFIFPITTLTSIIPTNAIVANVDVVTFDIWGLHYGDGSGERIFYLGILVIAAFGAAVTALVMRKKRWLQVRICFVLAILIAGVLFFEGIYVYKLQSILDYRIDYSFVMLAPLFALPLVYFAYRGIARDIVILASAERLR